ncbi:hypothetical protein ABW636_11695 [Aquimarina sp. 2201CG1-2-11]|uniref:hypothetical protein n=1 Tax=Aquimarina discodermiae TaxID=3231043 RepID=UPI003462736B
MEHPKKIILLLIVITGIYSSVAQESKNTEYIEFNDRRNIVHGVYLGLNLGYGKIENKSTLTSSLKLAYVANQQFELGVIATYFYSNQNALDDTSFDEDDIDGDLIGGYVGAHLEPIFFKKYIVNLSFPVLIGGGSVGYIESLKKDNALEKETYVKEWDKIFVVEPGVNLLFNVSRYFQIEAGVKYRFSSKFNLHPGTVNRINGYTFNAGIKIGIFNLGRNRYKKNIPDNE